MGLSLEVMIEVKLERHANYLLQVMVPGMDSLNRFRVGVVLKIEGMRDVRASPVLEAVERQQTVPTGHLR